MFTVLHSKDDKKKYFILCGCKVATYITVTSLAIIHRLLLYLYMSVLRCSASRIDKFESRFITTVDVIHNLALLAGLLTYLHTFTLALAHAHKLTLAHINNHTFAHSLTVTYTHTYTHNHYIYRHTKNTLIRTT